MDRRPGAVRSTRGSRDAQWQGGRARARPRGSKVTKEIRFRQTPDPVLVSHKSADEKETYGNSRACPSTPIQPFIPVLHGMRSALRSIHVNQEAELAGDKASLSSNRARLMVDVTKSACHSKWTSLAKGYEHGLH